MGGVANHYIGLRPFWKEKVKYQEIGRRSSLKNSGKYWLLWDVLKLIWNLIVFRPDIVLLNPSIGMSALKRDFLMQKIVGMFGKKTAIFIHGFNLEVFDKADKFWLRDNLNRALCIFVLAKDFKDRLMEAGVTCPIELATTKVDDRLLDDFDISCRNGEINTLLFLARVEKAKGIYETIEVYRILQQDYPNLKLNIVGDGSELENIREFIRKEGIDGIVISGKLSGADVANAYRNAELLMLLSSYGEGLPTTVLEGMAFGMPIITRPVGGLVDFFENGKMGVIDAALEPKKIARSIRPFLENQHQTKHVARYNHEYAVNHFMASKVAAEIENTLRKYK